MLKGHMTTKEAGKYLGYDPDYICQLCIKGELIGAEKFGNAWAIPEKAVINYKKPKDRKQAKKEARLAEINAARVFYAAQKLATA